MGVSFKGCVFPISELPKSLGAVPYRISDEELIQCIFHDSRDNQTNGWFICLEGSHSNGHDYIQDVLKQGVNRFIYSPAKTSFQPAGLQVADTNLFLAQIASFWRKRMNAKIVMVTGSSGKTTTKELLYFLLSRIFLRASKVDTKSRIIKSHASFNNHFGLPFTLLRITKHTKWAVIEAGTNHPGEIQQLSEWASPNHALITSIQKSHIGNFKNQNEIAEEKSDILCGMDQQGHIIYPALLPFRGLISKKAQKKMVTPHPISIDWLNIKEVHFQRQGTSFNYKGKKYFFPLLGKHLFNNLILVISFLELLERKGQIKKNDIEYGLSQLGQFKNISGRMELITTKNGVIICNDSYNASPSSYLAAIKSLSHEFSLQKLAGAFGYMAELGSYENKEHRNLAKLAAKHFKAIAFFSPTPELNQIFQDEWTKSRPHDQIFIAAPEEKNLRKGAAFLKRYVKKEDCILVKGSRSIRMERLLKLF